MKTIQTTWTGIRPLLMSNPQTVQLSNPFAVSARRINSAVKAARKKQDEGRLVDLEQESARNDWEGSAYYDREKNVFFLPDTVIIAAIRGGATALKKGRDVDRAVIVSETEVAIEGVTKHKTLEAYWQDKAFRFESPAKVPPKTGALIWKVRCMIPTGWKLTFSVEFDPELMPESTLRQAMQSAGLLGGLGGWRPKFGRFIVS